MAVEVSGVGGEITVVEEENIVGACQTAYIATVSDEAQSITVESYACSIDVGQAGGSVDVRTGVLGGIPYSGEYEAYAMFSEQVFPTRMKTMADDFTVHAINYTEERNDSGITVTIGG